MHNQSALATAAPCQALDVVINKMDQDLTQPFSLVRELLIKEFRIKPRKIKLESRIREDLGICGIDGFELFSFLHEKYGVDLSEFDHEKYFEPECFSAGAFFTKKWWTTFKHPKTLTVSQLVKAVDIGKWKE